MKILSVLLTCYFFPIFAMAPAQQALLQIRAGLSTCQGNRNYMEDFAVMLPELKPGGAFFGVYDGHGGNKAALFASEKLHLFLQEHITVEPNQMRNILLSSAIAQVEYELKKQNEKSGTTAVTAVIEKGHLYCGWVGDSRAILIRDKKVILATKDHKPNIPLEKQRIENCGGTVTNPWRNDSSYRAWPLGLAMSRSLGDIREKAKLENKGIIPEAEIVEDILQEGDLLILASDGLWDKLSNEEVGKKIIEFNKNKSERKNLWPIWQNGDNDLSAITTLLIDEALEKGSRDNISVLLVAIETKK